MLKMVTWESERDHTTTVLSSGVVRNRSLPSVLPLPSWGLEVTPLSKLLICTPNSFNYAEQDKTCAQSHTLHYIILDCLKVETKLACKETAPDQTLSCHLARGKL